MEQLAKTYARDQQATFYDRDLGTITPAQCFNVVVEDGTNIIFMAFDEELMINEEIGKLGTEGFE